MQEEINDFISQKLYGKTVCAECLLCRTDSPVEGRFCESCLPDHCPTCSASYVYYAEEEYEWECSHGCSFDGAEYAAHVFYTHLLNSDPTTILSYAGLRTELIIPNGTPITVHPSLPDKRPTEKTYGVHYSDNADEILETGIRHPSNLPDSVSSNMREYDVDTVREDAVYAWPYAPSFTEDALSWTSDYVIIEAPVSEVRVSSYRILNHATEEDVDGTQCIPMEHYDERLTYDVEALRKAVRMYGRPVDDSVLIA